VIEPLVALGTLALGWLTVPAATALDPGPSPLCPTDMRLVQGAYDDEVEHLCLDPRKDTKDTHCFAYWDDFTIAEGPSAELSVCMDQFEAPNQRGARPFVMKSFVDAERWCGARHKRVCTEAEWELACEGPDYQPLAYGWRVATKTCNSDKGWRPFDVQKLYGHGDDAKREVERLWQGAPSGRYVSCASPFGVYDLMGNVEEWVATPKSRRFPGALKGGFWAKPWTGCRGTNDAHEPEFRFYETGFRCCADPGELDAKGQPVKRAKK
jgi:formylglycine-generating enzyme required for sulfatase activity